jgi:hypothetical protein
MRTSRHPALRFALFWTGVVLIILTPFVGAIPGPGGVFVFAGGLALMLQNSHWAKRRFVIPSGAGRASAIMPIWVCAGRAPRDAGRDCGKSNRVDLGHTFA